MDIIDNPDFNVAEQVIKRYMDTLVKSPIMTHDDAVIHNVLRAAVVVLPYFRLVSAEASQKVMYDEFPQIGFTFNSLYNETVGFVVDGTPRRTNLVSWSNLIATYMNDVRSTKYVRENGSLGARMISAAFGRSGTVRNMGVSHQSLVADQRLLSYADHELLARWITRVNGLSDMVATLAVFLKLVRP
ncbi:MAG: hypothetical protein ACRDBQ_18640 [Shewanella sp.]